MKSKIGIKTISVAGLLTAVAAVLSIAESMLPLQLAVPVPGIRLGLANVVTMFALFYFDPGLISAVVLTRCALAALLAGSPISFAFSITGSMLAMVVMLLLKLGYNRHFSLYGISVGGAAAHNVGQIAVASVILQDASIFSYLPVLLLTGTAAGILTAAAAGPFIKQFGNSDLLKRISK